jgi:hypothetical protein
LRHRATRCSEVWQRGCVSNSGKGSCYPKSCAISRSGARQEHRDVEGRGGRRGWFGRSDLYSNCRRRNKFAWCLRCGDRQEVCGIPWFRERRGRNKSGSRTKNPGESKESRERQALIRDRGGLFGVVAAILLESFFARKPPKRDSARILVKNTVDLFMSRYFTPV